METRMWGMHGNRTEYGRYGNPTVSAAEKRVAALEGAQECVLFASGMTSITSTLLTLLNSGSHLVITDDSYRRTRQFCTNFLGNYGVECSVVPVGNYEALEKAIRPETRLIVSESPTNPYLRCVDLEKLSELGRRHNVKTLIDSTLATPINVRPLDFGIDLVTHSCTKYLGGHNDILAGALCGDEQLIALIRQQLWVLGGVLDPQQAFLLIRGMKTLGLRIARQNENGNSVAEFLENHPKVDRVWHPSRPSHPDHVIAKAQMAGYGGVVSFEVHTGSSTDSGKALGAASRVVDSVSIPLIAPSLGGVETLIEQPALMSYYELSEQERQEQGIKDNLVRLSLGVEDAHDIIADLDQALNKV